jgi:hypothetical protein
MTQAGPAVWGLRVHPGFGMHYVVLTGQRLKKLQASR